ncbi:MAG TPA: hypothetical protein VG323_14860 [Thermoanaerobaculia bacterium]|nr:hypothetical protein [Thermoanaerobaculia bacterium]
MTATTLVLVQPLSLVPSVLATRHEPITSPIAATADDHGLFISRRAISANRLRIVELSMGNNLRADRNLSRRQQGISTEGRGHQGQVPHMHRNGKHFILAVSIFLSLGCLAHQSPKPDQIVGSWRGDEYQGQLGKSINAVCFRQNGTIESVVETQAGRIVAKGTYTLSGDTLTLRIVGAVDNPKSIKARLVDGILTLADGEEETKYRRVAPTC